MARADQRRVTVVVEGIDLGEMDTRSGGAITAESTKHRPGGMRDEIDYGGPVSIEDLELTGVYDLDVLHPKVPALRAIVGRPNTTTVTEQPLDRDGNAKGKPDVYRGSLVGLAPPEFDANATGDVGKLTITVSVSGPVG